MHSVGSLTVAYSFENRCKYGLLLDGLEWRFGMIGQKGDRTPQRMVT